MKRKVAAASSFFAVVIQLAALGEVPQLINYQGRLLNGTNLVNGNVGISLRLFNVPGGGSTIYEDSNSVTVVDGLYSTLIGDQTNAGNFASALTNAQVWVEVAVNGAALTPRERLASVAYALNAQTAAGVVANGITASMFATGAVTAAALADGSVTASKLATNAVTTPAIADGAVTAQKVVQASDNLPAFGALVSGAATNVLGLSLARVGTNWFAAGAPLQNVGSEPAAGAVLIYNAGGTLALAVTNPAPATNDIFGFAVAGVGSNRFAVGSPYDANGTNALAGSVFLYDEAGTLLVTLTNPAPDPESDLFAYTMGGLGTNWVAVGAPYDDTSGTNAGIAYFYDAAGVLRFTVLNPVPSNGGAFGVSFAALGSGMVAIGAPFAPLGTNLGAGAVYVFNISGTLLATITNPAASPAAGNFGFSLAAVGSDRLVVGANGSVVGTNLSAGAAYLFASSGTLLAAMPNPEPDDYDGFGYSVGALGTNRIFVGADGDDESAANAGRVYVYDAGGTLLGAIGHPSASASAQFGYALTGVGNASLAVGAPYSGPGQVDLFTFATHADLLSAGVGAGGITAPMIAPDAVTSEAIADGAVGSGQLASGAVTTAAIADGAVGSAQLASDSVTTAAITNGAITTAKLAVGAVTSLEIFNGTIANADLGDASVTGSKILNGTISNSHLAANSVLAVNIAANQILAAHIATNSITGNKIVDGTVSNADLAAEVFATLGTNPVTGTVIVDGTISNADLAANAVSNLHIAANSIAGNKIVDGTISNADLSAQTLSNTFWRLDGNANTVIGTHFLGTTGNQQLELRANNQRGLLVMPGNVPNVIGGSSNNAVLGGVGVHIGGGASNTVGGSFTFIGGGASNSVANALYAAIAGGDHNQIATSANAAFIGGGSRNNIEGAAQFATIGGGISNRISSAHSTIGGGVSNQIDSTESTIGGGHHNAIDVTAFDSTIGGGARNAILTLSFAATIAGGNANTVSVSSADSTIGGGFRNTIEGTNGNVTIAGGNRNRVGGNSLSSTIGGGELNQIHDGSGTSVISGGFTNMIQSTSSSSTIGGGNGNIVGSNAPNSTIAGGDRNVIGSNNSHNVIGGGVLNSIGNLSSQSVIAGGNQNTIASSANDSAIAGGIFNTIAAGASQAFIAGGENNIVSNDNAFAAGNSARANHLGSFVWSDNDTNATVSTAANQWTARARGGARFITGINSSGAITSGVQVVAGGGAWTSLSDRHAKKNFEETDAGAILEKLCAMPVLTWSYKTQDDAIRHIGPTAQDFKAAFGVGETDTGITTVDADGVALAAIQALCAEVRGQKSEVSKLQTENAGLKAQLDALKARLDAVEKR